MFSVLKRVIGEYVNIRKKYYVILLFFSVIIAIVGVFEPFFIKNIISGIENYLKNNIFSFQYFFPIFLYWGLFIIFVSVVRGVLKYYIDKQLLFSYTDIFKKRAEKLLYIFYQDYLNKKQGEIYKIFDRGMEWSFFLLENLFGKILESFVSVVFITIILFYIDYRLAFATLSMIPIMIYVGYSINKKTIYKQKQVNDKRNEAFGQLQDSVSNIALVKTLTLEERIKKSLYEKLDFANTEQLKVSKWWTLSDVYVSILIMISRFLVLGTGIYLLSKGEITFAVLFLFFFFIGYIYYPLGFIFSSFRNFQKQLTGIEQMYQLFDSLHLDKDDGKKILTKIKGIIEYKNVVFSYDTKKVLNDISFTIGEGEKVAFVGNTGAGKSTIVSLLFRFYEIDDGCICIDGENIKNIKKSSLRKNIGFVMQDNSLFNTTIRENLLFAKPNATEEELVKALKNAQADFVLRLEKGLDTMIGERGLKLSGGEKQRLSIARLFLKDPKIIVLDEATSALDNRTEKLVQKALDKLMNGRTSIIIAHRLSTIEQVDKIIVLENGQVVEQGNYNHLIKKGGKFYQLSNPEHLIIQ